MGLKEHRHAAPSSVNMAIITLSDTRSADEDTTGQMIHELLIEAGHRVTGPTVVPEDRSDMERALETALEDEKVQAVILNGAGRGAYALIDYLRSEPARRLIEARGYGVD